MYENANVAVQHPSHYPLLQAMRPMDEAAAASIIMPVAQALLTCHRWVQVDWSTELSPQGFSPLSSQVVHGTEPSRLLTIE
jgi:hypothetical protein